MRTTLYRGSMACSVGSPPNDQAQADPAQYPGPPLELHVRRIGRSLNVDVFVPVPGGATSTIPSRTGNGTT